MTRAILPQQQRVMLSQASRLLLDKAIATAKVMAPEAFHTPDTLASRHFFHEPNPDSKIPCASWVKPFPVSPLSLKGKTS